MDFGEIDKKILTCLYHNSRESLSKIGKACGVSREQVEYRIRKFEVGKIIKKYLTVFNYGLLGLNEFVVVWLKVKSKKDYIKKELTKIPNMISVGEVLNGFDLYVDFVFKDKIFFERTFNEFLSKYGELVLDYDIFISTFVEIYHLKSFGKKSPEVSYSLIDESLKIDLTEKDLKILSIIDSNGRISALEISNSVGMTAEGVAYCLNKLRKKGVIVGTRILFDMEKAGFYFAGLRLNLKNVSGPTRQKVISFCRSHKNVNALSFGIGKYNSFIQFLYQSEEELRGAISDFKRSFGDLILNSELLMTEKEEHIRMLPLE